eukprot:g4683.t1
MSQSRDESRKLSFKKGISSEKGQRKREDLRIKVRKQKKEAQMAKRRMINTDASSSNTNGAAGARGGAEPLKHTHLKPEIACLPQLCEAMKAADPSLNYEGTRHVRKLLSRERDPPVEQVLEQGIVPNLVQFLTRVEHPQLQFEAAWALTNIASTTHTDTVVNAGAAPHLSNLLRHVRPEVREQAAWALGNIAGDSISYRDGLLRMTGCLQSILLNITQPDNISLLRNVTWCLSNLCRGKPQPHIEHLKPALPVLRDLLANADAEVLTDACWAMSYISDGNDSRIRSVVEAGVVGNLIKLLGHPKDGIVTPALRTVGNIVSGDADCTQATLDAGVLQPLSQLLSHRKKMVRKECCWALSNICAGTKAQISAVVASKEIMDGLVLHCTSGAWEVRKESAWALSNIATGGNIENIRSMIAAGGLGAICGLLDVDDPKIVSVALDGIEHILKQGDKAGTDYRETIEECEGLDLLEKLQEHQDDAIYKRAVKMLEKYFNAVDDEEEENRGGAVAAGTFGFGSKSGLAGTAPPAPMADNNSAFSFAPPAVPAQGGTTFDFSFN